MSDSFENFYRLADEAETLADTGNFRELKEVADSVLELMNDSDIPAEVYARTIPVIANALESTVYYRSLYEILLLYVDAVVRSGNKDIDIYNEAEKLLRLRIVLPADGWELHSFGHEIVTAIAEIFSSKELVRIIAHPDPGHLRKDPIEYTEKWEQIYYDVEDELDRLFAATQRRMGFCFRYWSAKQDLLKKKYGIEWLTPSQMNPRVMFD